MASKILLITGANTGLGFETVKALCQSDKAYTILLGGRSIDKAAAAVKDAQSSFPESSSVLRPIQIDLEDDDSIAKCFEQVANEYGKLDVLLNNAGGQFDQQLAQGKKGMREVWAKSWDVNTTGTYIVTDTFAPLLLKSTDPRLIFITSGTSTLAESDNLKIPVNKPPPKGWPKESRGITAYRASKTGMNMMMREWKRLLENDGVKVWCVSPGMLATGLGGNQAANKAAGALDPAIGSNLVRSVLEGARDHDAGTVVRKDDVQPW